MSIASRARFHDRKGRQSPLRIAALGVCLAANLPIAPPTSAVDERLLDPEVVFDWPLSSAKERAPWRTSSKLQVTRGLAVRITGDVGRIERDVSIEAATVDAIEVTLAAPNAAGIALAWRREGEAYASQRRVEIPLLPQALRPRAQRLDLRGEPHWQGRITGLRIELSSFGKKPRIVERIRGLRDRLGPEQLRLLAQTTRPVDLSHELQPARVVLPGSVWEVELPAGEAGRLTLVHGATAPLASEVEFRAQLVGPGGAQPRLIHQALLPAGSEPRWRRASVALPALSGEATRLRMEVVARSDRALDPRDGMTLWAAPALRRAAPAASPNVILISVDTLRADRLSLHGHPHATSPQIDAWAARRGVVFEQAVAAAPWTLPSHTSLLTGLDPNHHGVNDSASTVPATLVTLAEKLQTAGFTTAAVTGGAWLSPQLGLLQGVDRVHYATGAHDDDIDAAVDTAAALLETLPQPFFLFFHTFEVHEYRSLSQLAADHERYDQAIRITDVALGRLFAEIEALGLAGNTVVALTSDHGESFGDLRPRGHNHLYDDNLLVPLVISLPGIPARRIPQQVRSIDIAPTLLAAAGVERGSEPIDGVSLLPLALGEQAAVPPVAFSYSPATDRGVSIRLGGRVKYIYGNSALDEHAGEELYRLESDPLERSSAMSASPAELATLRASARQFLEALPGLHLRLRNASAQPFTLRLSADVPVLSRHAVTSWDLPCACARMTKPGELSLELPAKTGYPIVIEHLGGDRVSLVALNEQGDIVLERSLTPEALLEPQTLQLRPEAAVDLWWSGPARPRTSPVEEDLVLRKRLEALGYLEQSP